MSDNKPKTQISMEQFLTISVNMLHNYFFKSHKEKARRLYKEIARGDKVNVGNLTVGDDKANPVKLMLSLDHSEFKGHLTFHLFQQVLGAMLRGIASRLEKREELRFFTAKETGEVIVYVPGLIRQEDTLNMLVLGLQPGKQGAMIRLQFLDTDQFRKEAEAAAEPGVEEAPAESGQN